CLRDDEVVAPAAQVDAVLLPTAARVGGRLQLPDQPQLLERGLELGAEHAPLDPVECHQRRLNRRPLALAPEVGAKTGAEVTGPADVEHLSVPVTEEADGWRARPCRAGARTAAGRERAGAALRGNPGRNARCGRPGDRRPRSRGSGGERWRPRARAEAPARAAPSAARPARGARPSD